MIDIDIMRVLNVGIAMSTQKNRNELLELIISEAMLITHCDGGTLYTYEGDCLKFKIMRNNSLGTYQGGEGSEVNLPPVPLIPEHVCAYCAINRCSINISDVYDSSEFDFSGPRKYDSITGYRTRSMLVVPFENTRGDIIGVLQLINAEDESGNVIAFSHDTQTVIAALASQAAVCITNTMYMQDIRELFQSFVQVMITAIDELSPYNVNHTRRITEFANLFLDYLNDLHGKGEYAEYFDESRREQLIMAAWMHDIGKLITPLTVMNKATRLGDDFSKVNERFTTAQALLRIKFLENDCTEHEYLSECKELAEFKALLPSLNNAIYIDDDALAKLALMASKSYPLPNGEAFYLLQPHERECLSVRKGTLTTEERTIMENHVVLTAKLLSKIHFGSDMANVPNIAAMHHEFLDGSGYPSGLHANELSTEVRILSILDIYEALTATDRPYKKTMPVSKAFQILGEMADRGKLDRTLVTLLAKSQISL